MMTLWSEIVGYCCTDCGKWATHWYCGLPICCSCHIGHIDKYMELEAIKMNSLFQKGQPIEVYSDDSI